MKYLLSPKRSTSGFTLLEVLVAVIMIGILFAIAGPSWVGLLNRQRSNNARTQVLQAIRQTQAEALRTKTCQTLAIDTTQDPPVLTVRGQRETLGLNSLRPKMISLKTSPTTTNISFDGNGNLYTVGGESSCGQQATPTPVNASGPLVAITLKAPANTGPSRCILIETILGATHTAEAGETNCP
jgi:prepilin-type N-terminal cleavage/methylation domain-containing protein